MLVKDPAVPVVAARRSREQVEGPPQRGDPVNIHPIRMLLCKNRQEHSCLRKSPL